MLLQMQGICKNFIGQAALKDINLELHHGEVLAVLGLNGAGKSTLANVLSGAYLPDAGEIYVNDVQVSILSPADAQKNGIFAMYQEPNFVAARNVMDNIFLGNYQKKLGIFVDDKKMALQAKELLQILGSDLSPYALVGSLALSEKYIVSAARAFLVQARIFIMDEPTEGLSHYEKQILFQLICRLKQEGAGIIYITHRLDEVEKICDSMIVLRDGKMAAAIPVSKVTQEEIITLVSGRSLQGIPPLKPMQKSPAVLETKNLYKRGIYKNINLSLHKGEVVGIAGNLGSGRSAILKTLFGEMQADGGEMILLGQKVNLRHPLNAIQNRIGYLSDDRIAEGAFMEMNVLENTVLPAVYEQRHSVFIDSGKDISRTLDAILDLDIKVNNLEQKMKYVSSGNQQKIMLSRWLLGNCHILLLDQPTKGIDVCARNEIFCWIREKAAEGISIMISSSDCQELKTLCDTIFVLNRGRVVEKLSNHEVTEQRLLTAMEYCSVKSVEGHIFRKQKAKR